MESEMYYCRSKEVTLRVLQQGAWDHKQSPWKPHGRSLSTYIQSYLRSFCLEDKPPNHGEFLAPSPCIHTHTHTYTHLPSKSMSSSFSLRPTSLSSGNSRASV